MASTSQASELENEAEKESRQRIADVIEVYDSVIQANNNLDQKYKVEEDSLMKKLREVQAELQVYKTKREFKREPEKHNFMFYTVGKPYFKDKELSHPPDNKDTILMKQFEMYDFSNVMAVSGWTVGDRSRLLTVLLDMSKDIIKKQIHEEISQLSREKTKEATCKIAQLKRELQTLKHKTLEDLDLKMDQEFDWEEVAQKLNKRHSSREYKAIWNLFFHPKVNKSVWSPEEHQELQRLAAIKKMQDWESIAKALNTGRTGYQCFVYFRTNMDHSSTGRKWSQEEMNYLERVINLYREENYIPWGKVAASIENRTKIQCYNKYMRMIEGRKGRFLPEEDAVILNFANVYGPDYRRMASFLAGRSSTQLRIRHRLLRNRVSATWSLDDDKKLLQVMANQDSNANYSTATRHFPGKDRQNIRSRYTTLMRWMRSHPHSDLSTAPRRGARRLAHGEPTSNLLKAIDNLRNKMQTELKKAKPAPAPKLKLSRDSSYAVIQDSILGTIASLQLKQQLLSAAVGKTQRAKVENSIRMVQVQDITTKPQNQLNLTNIKHILILLNTKLADKKAFYSTHIGKGLEAIEEQTEEDDQKTKSYSRVEETSIDNEPDIRPTLFGTIAGRRKFLFPPNFALITGSRVILSQLNSTFAKGRPVTNIKALVRRNPLVKEHLTTLRERFNDLFAWSYILSNEPPEFYTNAQELLPSHRPALNPLPDAFPIASTSKSFPQKQKEKKEMNKNTKKKTEIEKEKEQMETDKEEEDETEKQTEKVEETKKKKKEETEKATEKEEEIKSEEEKEETMETDEEMKTEEEIETEDEMEEEKDDIVDVIEDSDDSY